MVQYAQVSTTAHSPCDVCVGKVMPCISLVPWCRWLIISTENREMASWQAFYHHACTFALRSLTLSSVLSQEREFGINYTKKVMENICYFIGSYIYIEASPQRFGDVARLLSKWMEPNQSACVQFWYHMYGSDIGNLSFYLKTNQSKTLVWRLSSDQGDRWKFGQFSLISEKAHRVSYTKLPKCRIFRLKL